MTCIFNNKYCKLIERLIIFVQIIAVAVFSFLDIPFGIAAIVLSMDALLEEGDCNSDWCVIPVRNDCSWAPSLGFNNNYYKEIVIL